MRNTAKSDNALIGALVDELKAKLPAAWAVARRTGGAGRKQGYAPDAVIELRAPDGTRATVLVEAKAAMTAQVASALAPQLDRATRASNAGGTILVAPFLSEMTRERLRASGISYLDLTGNLRVQLDRPALYLEAQGALKDPAPLRRGVRSLKGPKAARLVRALCDWRPPVGVRELARRAKTDPGYAARVLSLLADEDLVRRDDAGVVRDVRWSELLRRWARDYDAVRRDRGLACLAPRGIDGVLDRLKSYRKRYAVTGSFAVPSEAAVARGRMLTCFVDQPASSLETLGLRPADTGANVLLIEAFDSVAYERGREQNGLRLTALSQCVADLLTSSGREPSEAESLLRWMEHNERAWRA